MKQKFNLRAAWMLEGIARFGFDWQRTLCLLIPAVIVSIPVTALAANPFITTIYTADPSAHVWSDGRLYVYPSRDIDPARGCDLMDHYHVFSTDNMVDWRDEGEILNASQVDWGRKEGGFMWAPDAAYKDGTYYFYFPHPSDTKWNDSWKIGVATSKYPAKDFKPGGYIKGVGGDSMIDPAVFIDTDGQAYMYYGGGGHCVGVKLKPDMVEIEGTPQPMEGLHDFHEASWVFKRDGVYYLSYADNHPDQNEMEYATSSNPLGPWTAKGAYLLGTGCDTTHGSVVEYKGKWYQFYHNKSLSGQNNLRSVCVDLLDFNADGTIQTITQTKTGPPAVGPAAATSNDKRVYLVGDSTVGNGADVEGNVSDENGQTIHNLQLDNSFVQWTKIDGGKDGGRSTLELTYAAQGNAKLHLEINGEDYSFINALDTGGWDHYTGHSVFTVNLKPGESNEVKFIGGSGGVNVAHLAVTPLPN